MRPRHSLSFVHEKQRDLHQNDKSIWVPAIICFFSPCKTVTLGPDLQVCIGPSPHLWFLYAKQRLLDLLTSLYGYQTSPAVLCSQTSVISTRNTSFYGFQPTSVVLYMKTAALGPDLQVCVGPRPHLWF